MIKDTWLDWYQDRQVDESVVSIAELLKQKGASKVLDFGCGTGRHIVYLAKMGFDVYGLDWSGASVNIARKELSEKGLHAELRVWDMNETPLPYDGSFFDGVLSIRVFHHTLIEKIRMIASEIQRITKKGGFIYVEVPSWNENGKIENPDVVEIEPRTLIWSKGIEAHVPHHHFLRNELIGLFQQCTVSNVENKDRHFCLTLVRK